METYDFSKQNDAQLFERYNHLSNHMGGNKLSVERITEIQREIAHITFELTQRIEGYTDGE